MKTSRALHGLVPLVIVLTLVVSAAGLFWMDSGSRFTFTTMRGASVEMFGAGLYRNDSVFMAAGFRGTDLVTLALVVPLLVTAHWLYRRGSLRGQLLQLSFLSYTLYYSCSLAIGASFNPMLLAYVTLFSASLFGFILAFREIDAAALVTHFRPALPNRAIWIFSAVSGVVLFGVWMMDIVIYLLTGKVPEPLGPYATLITYALDLGVIVPALIITAVLVRRRVPTGYLMAVPLLVLCSIIGIVVLGQTAFQLQAGLRFTPPQLAIYSGSFILMTLISAWITVAFFRNLSPTPLARTG